MSNVISLAEARDPSLVLDHLEQLRARRRAELAAPRVGANGNGVMQTTHAIDTQGYAVVDGQLCYGPSQTERVIRSACGSRFPCGRYIGVLSQADVAPGPFELGVATQKPILIDQLIFPSSLGGLVTLRRITLGAVPMQIFDPVGPGVDVQVFSEGSLRAMLGLSYIEGTNSIALEMNNVSGAVIPLVSALLVGWTTARDVR